MKRANKQIETQKLYSSLDAAHYLKCHITSIHMWSYPIDDPRRTYKSPRTGELITRTKELHTDLVLANRGRYFREQSLKDFIEKYQYKNARKYKGGNPYMKEMTGISLKKESADKIRRLSKLKGIPQREVVDLLLDFYIRNNK